MLIYKSSNHGVSLNVQFFRHVESRSFLAYFKERFPIPRHPPLFEKKVLLQLLFLRHGNDRFIILFLSKKGPLGPSVWPISENRSSSSVWFQSPTAWSIPQKRARSSKRLGYVRSAIEILVGSRPNQPEPDSLSPVPSLKPLPFVPLPGVIKHGLQENTPFGHLVPWIFICLCPMNFQGCSHIFPYIPMIFPWTSPFFRGCPSDALSFVLQIQVSFGLLQLQLCLRVYRKKPQQWLTR